MKKTDDMKVYMNNYMKTYRENNKDKINEHITCDICGVNYNKRNKSHHIKSKSHKLKLLEKRLNEVSQLIAELS